MFEFFRPKKREVKEEPVLESVPGIFPQKIIRRGVFNEQEKLEIVKRVAWFWSEKEILNFVKEEFGKECTRETIKQYKTTEKWKPFIEKFREDYTKLVTDVPLANKRKRLDELQKHYDHHMNQENYLAAQGVIKDFRDELEKKVGEVSFSFTQINNTQFNDMTDEELQQEKAKALEQYEKARKMRMLAQGEHDPTREN